jgi:glycosyltransferase involved in cell wall biosynthesis
LKPSALTTAGRADSRGAIAVSVVVPCLDAERTIRRSVTSLLEQRSAVPFEIVVVDNGSSDRSVATVRELEREGGPRLRLVCEPQRGAARARNLGLSEAAGDVVLFTDADCIAEPYWLAALRNSLLDPRVLIAGGEIVGDPDQRGLVARYARNIGLLSQDHTLRHPRGPFFQTANLGVRRHDALAIGGFDPELTPAGEDADFCWRLARHDPERELRLVRWARVRHVHRTTASALFRQFRGYGRGDVALARRHGGVPGSEAVKLAADVVRAAGLPLFACLGVGIAAVSGDAVALAAPWLRVVQAAGRRLGQVEGLVRDARRVPRTCA